MKLEHTIKRYGLNVVSNDIDSSFGDSRTVGPVGKNGVGRATVMKVMNDNIIKLDRKVDIDNTDNIGFSIEYPKLYDNKSGLYNLKLFAQVLGKGLDKVYTDKIIDALGMRPYIEKKVKRYSMGMKQRLVIAISLVNKPKFLVLDEPTNNMGPDGSIDVLTTIRSLVNELDMRILMSSHKLEDIELTCDRAIFLRDGHFVRDISMEEGAASDITIVTVDHRDLDRTEKYLAEHFQLQNVDKVDGHLMINAQKNYQVILKALSELDIYPKHIETRKSSLRDTYFSINQRGDK